MTTERDIVSPSPGRRRGLPIIYKPGGNLRPVRDAVAAASMAAAQGLGGRGGLDRARHHLGRPAAWATGSRRSPRCSRSTA